jgi:hypothetical protein
MKTTRTTRSTRTTKRVKRFPTVVEMQMQMQIQEKIRNFDDDIYKRKASIFLQGLGFQK